MATNEVQDVGGFPAIHAGGEWRVLNVLPTPEEEKSRFGAFADAGHSLDPSQWREVDFSFYGSPILNQGRLSSCTGHAGCTAFDIVWRMSGRKPQQFSPTYLYSKVNNGRDQGASVGSILRVLSDAGVCLLSQCPETVIFPRQYNVQEADQTAQRFRVQEAYVVSSFGEMCSALSLGFPVCLGIQVGQDFGQLDANGVAPVPRRSIGGHALCGMGLKKLPGGEWAIKIQNSWSAQWGLRGYAYIREAHFDQMIDSYAIEFDRPDTQAADDGIPAARTYALHFEKTKGPEEGESPEEFERRRAWFLLAAERAWNPSRREEGGKEKSVETHEQPSEERPAPPPEADQEPLETDQELQGPQGPPETDQEPQEPQGPPEESTDGPEYALAQTPQLSELEKVHAERQALEEDQRRWQAGWEDRKDRHGRLSPDDVVTHQKEHTDRARAAYQKKLELLERESRLLADSRPSGTRASPPGVHPGERTHASSHLGVDPDDGRSHLDILPPLPTVGGVVPPLQSESHSNVDAVDPATGKVLRTPFSVPHKVETAPPPGARTLLPREAALVRPWEVPVHADVTRQEVEAPGEVLPADHPRSPTMVNEPMSAQGRPADPRVMRGRPAELSAGKAFARLPPAPEDQRRTQEPPEEDKARAEGREREGAPAPERESGEREDAPSVKDDRPHSSHPLSAERASRDNKE